MLQSSDLRLPEHWELQLCHLALAALDAETTTRPFLYKHGRHFVYVVPLNDGTRLDVYYGVRRLVTVEELHALNPEAIACRARGSFNIDSAGSPSITLAPAGSWANQRCKSELKRWSIQRPTTPRSN
jgi:hypothetical protein